MSKDEWDRKRWSESPPTMPESWTRYPVTAEHMKNDDPWEAIPDEMFEDGDRPVMQEWRPSSMGGYGLAAMWMGPREKNDN